MAAIEVACWDIKGKALGVPLYELLGGLVRDRVPVYANGWYQVDRSPEAFADAVATVIRRGYSAMKFDPFRDGLAHATRRQQDEAIDIVAAVRDVVGADADIMIEGHNRFAITRSMVYHERDDRGADADDHVESCPARPHRVQAGFHSTEIRALCFVQATGTVGCGHGGIRGRRIRVRSVSSSE